MIIPGLTIGENAFICASSGVFHDVDAGAVMRGNPA
jgi:acetyltransferase-like isoleucine patch superfamily enzyme